MIPRKTLRPAAIVAGPVMFVVLATLLACDAPTTPPDDNWADAVTTGLQMSANAQFLDVAGQPSIAIGPAPTKAPILRAFRPLASGEAMRQAPGAGDRRTIVRHFRRSRDSVTSIALVHAKDGDPPKFIFVFENGRVSAIVSPKYANRGNGVARASSRVTFFDRNGKATLQADVKESAPKSKHAAPGSPYSAVPAVVADAVEFADEGLATVEGENGPCTSLWITYVTASTVLAAAATALGSSGVGCLGTGLTCPVLGTAALAWLIALDKWQQALDRLTDCIAASKKTDTSSGGGGPDTWTGVDADDPYRDTTMTVTEFIDDAIARGNYACADDGNYCVYYAA
jgi:hypothetical protein